MKITHIDIDARGDEPMVRARIKIGKNVVRSPWQRMAKNGNRDEGKRIHKALKEIRNILRDGKDKGDKGGSDDS